MWSTRQQEVPNPKWPVDGHMLFRALKEVCYFYSYYLLNFVDQDFHSSMFIDENSWKGLPFYF